MKRPARTLFQLFHACNQAKRWCRRMARAYSVGTPDLPLVTKYTAQADAYADSAKTILRALREELKR